MVVRPKLLLHPNIPKPLHGTSPRTIFGDDWWALHREQAYIDANFCCEACGVEKSRAAYHKWLEAHETYRINYSKGRAVFTGLVALCHSCHNFIHSGRLQHLANAGTISMEKFNDIIARGNKVLAQARLARTRHAPTKIASWEKWRLVIDGVEYKGKFKSVEDWADYYGGWNV